jgi:dihydroneopterin aldolase
VSAHGTALILRDRRNQVLISTRRRRSFFGERPARKAAAAITGFRLAGASVSATLDFMEDQIHIEGLDLFAHIGVPEEERATAQRLRFSVTYWPLRLMPELNDEIERAVNYAAVCAELRKFVGQRSDKLIETLANALALHLLETFEIRRVTIGLRKYILPEVEFVSVIVTRERSEK